MTIGIDHTGKRITPTPHARAFCQICKNEIIARTGEIYAWHFAHKSDHDCDAANFKEHETSWHRGWKNLFPEDWRENAIEKFGEKHLADILTPEGLVIEFQNSSINPATIRIRENFYGNMIWVINAADFQQNFKMASVVKRKLRVIDSKVNGAVSDVTEDYKEKIKDLREKVENLQRQETQALSALREGKQRLEFFSNHLQNIDQLTERVINNWITRSYLEYWLNKVTSEVDQLYGEKCSNLKKQLEKFDSDLLTKEGHIKLIDSFERFEHNGVPYSIIPAKTVTRDNFPSVIVIEKETRSSFFPSVKKIDNEFELARLQYNPEKIDFGKDLRSVRENLVKEIELLNDEKRQLNDYIPSIRGAIKENLLQRVTTAIRELELQTKKDEEKWEDLMLERSGYNNQAELLKLRMPKAVEEAREQSERQFKSERFAVMKSHKGKYLYDWKHERTTWQYAEAEIFFDTGNGFLFKRVSDNELQKISIEDFLKVYRNVPAPTSTL